MPNLLAMSFEGELAPSFDLLCLRPGGRLPDGWGLGCYPGGEPAATVLKEPAPAPGSIRGELLRTWEQVESSLFVLHMRRATWGQVSSANTQPFSRPHGGRDFLFAHAGSLKQRLEPRPGAGFDPIGSTDTEAVFCELLGRIAERGWRSLGEVDLRLLRGWLGEINRLGALTVVLTDGRDLIAYADAECNGSLHVWTARPPYGRLVFGDADLVLDLSRRGVKSRKGIILSSDPLYGEGLAANFRLLAPGHLLAVRQGAVRDEIAPDGGAFTGRPFVTRRSQPARPQPAEVRRLAIHHRTVYRYARPVERSTHLLRLFPVHDRMQRLLEHQLTVSVPGKARDFDDVFGNRVRRLHIDVPFSELAIEVRAEVEIHDPDPASAQPLHARSAIPLVWMPWQRHMLQPYLLPPELPESELIELTGYAMSFVERNDYDLLDTLIDLNHSIHEEYAYQPNATLLSTTPFDVYTHRRGVCQDFANLFICLARLLGVPARYVCGYLYTGPKHDNRLQSEASHAWVQVYLPEVGWQGFDPTNGILTQNDHVRVAIGRNFVDVTPTSGTLFRGGGGETLEVSVRIDQLGRAGQVG